VRLGLPDGPNDPGTWAARLDEWVVRHRNPWDSIDGETPVSDGLLRMGPPQDPIHLDGQRTPVAPLRPATPS